MMILACLLIPTLIIKIRKNDAAQSLDENASVHLYHTFKRLIEQVQEEKFSPNIIYHGEEPVEYAVVPLTQYGPDYHCETFESVSEMLETYYASKEILTRIRQKSSDLRRIVQTALERNRPDPYGVPR